MSVVLMYHGIFPDNDTSTIDAEDLPYALSVSNFTRQLDLLAQRRVGLYDAGETPQVVITFDDGHASSLELAAPLLLERQLSAYFFITSDFIGQRPGFMTADELSELSRLPGMCIGSHGRTHRFFDDLSVQDSLLELTSSKRALEAICGARCDSISFPGGRFSAQTLDQMVQAGYTQWFGSEIGLVSAERLLSADRAEKCGPSQLLAGEIEVANVEQGRTQDSGNLSLEDRWLLAAQYGDKPLERVAIRRNAQIEEFRRIIDQEKAYFRQKRRNSQVKQLLRSAIGNRLYHGLYKSISAR